MVDTWKREESIDAPLKAFFGDVKEWKYYVFVNITHLTKRLMAKIERV